MSAFSPRLNLLVLRSQDIHRAAKFYEAIGLSFTAHRHGSGPEHYASELNGFVFEIYPLGPKSSPTTGTRIGFHVNDVDSALALLIEAGAILVTAPADSEWGRRAVAKDPDGHLVELTAAPEKI